MKILIAGSRGMLGTDLLKTMQPGNEIRGIDLADIDITHLEQCLSVVQEFRPEVIINAAAFTRVDDCETNPAKAFSVNGDGAGNLARAPLHPDRLLVHYSTDYIFDGLKAGGVSGRGLRQTRKVSTENPSLREKIRCAGIARITLILRTSWLFGRNGPNFIRTIVNAAQQGTPLRVVNDQKGSPPIRETLPLTRESDRGALPGNLSSDEQRSLHLV